MEVVVQDSNEGSTTLAVFRVTGLENISLVTDSNR